MRLFVDRVKILNLIRSHQISQLSNFRIKYEYLVSHQKEKIHVMRFFLVFFFISFVAFVIKAEEFSYLLRNPFFQIRFNHISKTTRIYLEHHFIVCTNSVCSFIFDKLTSKVTDVSSVFL